MKLPQSLLQSDNASKNAAVCTQFAWTIIGNRTEVSLQAVDVMHVLVNIGL
jgi:hypothetical protein